MYADQAADLFIGSLRPGARVLDVGAGDDGDGFGELCRAAGLDYVPFDWGDGEDWESLVRPSYIQAFDGVYMSHSLEHMLDTHHALRQIHNVLKPGGVVAITVPPAKHEIVGGHVTLWNAGLLLYRMILAGFNCRDAAVKTYGYNISVVVRQKRIEQLPTLMRDRGDIEILSYYFPKGLDIRQGFDGRIAEHNWRAV